MPPANASQRTTHHHGNLREALIDYAIAAAREGIVDRLSLRQASRDLGVSPGAAYRHFAVRQELMHAVAQRGFDMLAQRFEVALPFNSTAQDAGDARARFIALSQAYVDFAQENRSLWRLMFDPYGLLACGEKTAEVRTRAATYEWLAKSLQELADHALIAPPTAGGQFFAWTVIHGLSDLYDAAVAQDLPDSHRVAHHVALIMEALG